MQTALNFFFVDHSYAVLEGQSLSEQQAPPSDGEAQNGDTSKIDNAGRAQAPQNAVIVLDRPKNFAIALELLQARGDVSAAQLNCFKMHAASVAAEIHRTTSRASAAVSRV